ncbi:MAG: type II toxin-antitoxin system RelE/ParE family toxin [Rhodocyclaceae bacterium]
MKSSKATVSGSGGPDSRIGRHWPGSTPAFAVCPKGNPGDVKPVGQGISELRIDYGPGYRVYFKRCGLVVLVLLTGGDKSTQAADIALAMDIAKNWKA